MKRVLHIILYVVMFFLGYLLPTWTGRTATFREGSPCEGDTIRTTDTVRIAQPKLKSEANMGKINIRVPRTKGGGAGGLERLCVQDTDSVTVVETNKSTNLYFGVSAGGEPRCSSDDSITVALPLTQRVYESKDYIVWVSGVKPQLDSIMILKQRETVKIRQPPKRWHIGPTIGIGLTPQGAAPFVGVSLTYSVISF